MALNGAIQFEGMKDARTRRELWARVVFWAAIICGLVGCAHSQNEEQAHEDLRLMDAVVARWVAEWPDRKVMRYLGAAEFGLAVVGKLKAAGYVIEPASEPRPPRDSWDTDESVRWVELAVDEARVAGESATVKVTTRWLSGSRREEFLLRKEASGWVVSDAGMALDADLKR